MSLAVLFPGQGSQYLGMLQDVGEEPCVAAVFSQAANVLGYDLWSLLQQGPESKLNTTEFTQPALLAASYALWQLWQQSCEVKPKFLAGHSLGEYSALVCSGAIDFAAALKLVSLRGRLMQQAVAPGVGAMAAIIGLTAEKVAVVCEEINTTDNIVAAVNFNSAAQIVIAGHRDAVDKAIVELKNIGAKRCVPLPVSVPSHCALMQDAAKELAEYIATVEVLPPKIAVVHNYDVAVHEDPTAIKEALVKQLFNPVRWHEIMEFFLAEGIDTVVECGPGKVLTGLTRRLGVTAKALDGVKFFHEI